MESVAVEPGDRLSFVVDCCDDHGFDSFRWPVTITETGAGQGSWSSIKGFGGPAESRLEKQIVFAWWLAYQRPPALDEYQQVAAWIARQVEIDSQAENGAAAVKQAMVSLCQSLLGSNEFLYVE